MFNKPLTCVLNNFHDDRKLHNMRVSVFSTEPTLKIQIQFVSLVYSADGYRNACKCELLCRLNVLRPWNANLCFVGFGDVSSDITLADKLPS